MKPFGMYVCMYTIRVFACNQLWNVYTLKQVTATVKYSAGSLMFGAVFWLVVQTDGIMNSAK